MQGWKSVPTRLIDAKMFYFREHLIRRNLVLERRITPFPFPPRDTDAIKPNFATIARLAQRLVVIARMSFQIHSKMKYK